MEFKGNNFIPFELGKDSLVETAINEIGPLLVDETDLLSPISPVKSIRYSGAKQVQLQT